MMIHSRHFLCRLPTLTIRSHCFASTLVLAEQVDGGKLAPVTLNTYVSVYVYIILLLCFTFSD